MDFKETVKSRYSVRQYEAEAILEETTNELLEMIVPTVLVSVGYPADGQPVPKLRYPVRDIVL